MSKKTVLLTNDNFSCFAGSQLVIYDLAKEFLSMRWEVIIASFEWTSDLEGLFREAGATCVDLRKECADQFGRIDLLWGHHFTTFDRVLVEFGCQPGMALFSSLSPYEPLESPPLYFECLSGVAANSHETLGVLVEMGIPEESCIVLENSVPDNFFEGSPVALDGVLRKVAVVSNHVPSELLNIAGLLSEEVSVSYYGLPTNNVLITECELRQYDLVVTIGRTVQCCFSLGVPVYCYDRFGGPGYITKENLEKAAFFNFSGRCCQRKLTAFELVEDILGGYQNALLALPLNRDMASKRFRLSSVVKKALEFCEAKRFETLSLVQKSILLRQGSHKSVRRLNSVIRNKVRALAFNLPQFHATLENNRWWGEGFTEWTNVKQGVPNFEGHYQPHVPGDMGYYNMLDVETLRRQAQMSRSYGIHGFCYYYYWFDGKRLLEKPVDLLIANPDIDQPFCLCWANENWTRRWDGGNQEVLIAQSYDPALHERFARDLIPYFSDARYIRIAGKPVLLIYRGDIIPDFAATLAAWRSVWREAGVGEVYLVGVESFEVFHPVEVGLDAGCEFLPHQVDRLQVALDEPLINPQLPVRFIGDYRKLASYWPERPRAPYKRFRSLVPGWDNSARRRKGDAGLFINSTPESYGKWLERTLELTCEELDGDERLVFINAWNEWGEGCHLEPDIRHGCTYLEATRNALTKVERAPAIPRKPFNPFPEDYRDWCSSRLMAPGEQACLPERIACWVRQPRLLVVVDGQAASLETIEQTLVSLAKQVYVPTDIWLQGSSVQPVTSSLPFTWVDDAGWLALDVQLAQAVDVDWVLLLRAGDELNEHALLLLAERIFSTEGMACCYFDEDSIVTGERLDPFFKPDFNLDFMRSYPYCGRVLAFELQGLIDAGGFRGDMGVLSPQDLLWRLMENRGFHAIGHLAHVLVHCRYTIGMWLAEAQVQEMNARVVSAHLSRLGVAHSVGRGALPVINRVSYQSTERPLVSIVVTVSVRLPLLQRCIESLFEKTGYPNYELLIADNGTSCIDSQKWLAGIESMGSERIRVIRRVSQSGGAVFINWAVAQAQGGFVVLLSGDTAIIDPGWLEALLNHARRPEVGIVGGRLSAMDGSVRHAGYVLGLQGAVGQPFESMPRQSPGYMHRLLLDQNYSAVSGDCMMIRQDVFDALGGFDEVGFAGGAGDIDFCLRAHQAGYLTVWTPYAEVLQGDSSARQPDRELNEARDGLLRARWLARLAHDTAYSPSLSLNEGFVLEAASERLPWQPFSQRAIASFLCHPADRFGSGHYRLIEPFKALQRSCLAQGAVIDYFLRPEHLERMSPDAVVLQRLYGEGKEKYLQVLKGLSSTFKVFELDDYILELPSRSIHSTSFGKDTKQVLQRALTYCDRLVVSTEPLAEAMRAMHPDIRVAPNHLPMELWDVQGGRRDSLRPRVGWAGGAGHSGDLELLADVVKTLAGEVDWVFMGMCPPELLPYIAEYHDGVRFDDYPQRLAALDLDLALAPLENNLFNQCKSNLRLLEYGACGFPVIASDIEPYRGQFAITRVQNRPEQWIEAIRSHLSDRAASQSMGLELQRQIRTDWMLTDSVALEWGRIWLPD